MRNGGDEKQKKGKSATFCGFAMYIALVDLPFQMLLQFLQGRPISVLCVAKGIKESIKIGEPKAAEKNDSGIIVPRIIVVRTS